MAKNDVTLHDLYQECDRYISLKKDAKMIEGAKERVYHVKAKEKFSHKKDVDNSNRRYECWNCGQEGHRAQRCSKIPEKCRKCRREGHQKKYCDRVHRFSTNRRDSDSDSDDDSNKNSKSVRSVVIGKVVSSGSTMRQYVDVCIDDCQTLSLQLDTGSDVTLLSEDQWKSLGSPSLEKTDVHVLNASGNTMKVYGKFKCDFHMVGERSTGFAHVTPNTSLVGLDWIRKNEHMSYHLNKLQDDTIRQGSEVTKVQVNKCSVSRIDGTKSSPTHEPSRKENERGLKKKRRSHKKSVFVDRNRCVEDPSLANSISERIKHQVNNMSSAHSDINSVDELCSVKSEKADHQQDVEYMLLDRQISMRCQVWI